MLYLWRPVETTTRCTWCGILWTRYVSRAILRHATWQLCEVCYTQQEQGRDME